MSRRSSPSEAKRLNLLGTLSLCGFAAAALSQARVNVFSRNSVLDTARETGRFMVSRTDYAKRGAIFSADGKPLAQDEDTRELTINFSKVPASNPFYMELAAATGLPASEFKQLADSGGRTRVWRQAISSAQAKRIQDVKTKWRADGLSLGRSGRRQYPFGAAAAGFVGALRDGTPLTGLELGFSKLLGGRNGKTEGLVDKQGAFLPTRLGEGTVIREDGKSITLTIDSELQVAATAAIKQAVEINKADQGVAVVMDPKTGDVLAMANWPSYEPSSFGQTPAANGRSLDFNPSYMAALEPGSTFKILTVAKALDQKKIGANQSIHCGGGLAVGKRVVRCDAHGGNRAHGTINPDMAIAKSCNVSAATWALKVGHKDFVQYMEDLGLFSKTKLGLPKETAGMFNRNEYAKQLQLATFGFGQSLITTPVGLTSAFTALANGGLRMEPRLVKKIGDNEIPPKAAKQVVSAETSETVLGYMRSVFESDRGTGHSLRIPGYVLGGKTGTAQKVNRKLGGGYVSNFVGFVPGDAPQAVILVMVDNPKAGAYYGASVAGPVFVSTAKAVIRRFGIPPKWGTVQKVASEQDSAVKPAQKPEVRVAR